MTPSIDVSHLVEAPGELANRICTGRMVCGCCCVTPARRTFSPARRAFSSARRAFSMVELVVVVAVAVVLTGMMLPALASVKENVRRVTCMSNLRTLGAATSMYATNNDELLPAAISLKDKEDIRPQDLMMAHLGEQPNNWNGLGWLYYARYCPEPQCFYCPSHEGEHPFEKYEEAWRDERNEEQIFMNYHYGGDRTWTSPFNKRRLEEGHRFIIATDGLRTRSDVNHGNGLNMLLADGSVNWNEKVRGIFPQLPVNWETVDPKDHLGYFRVWSHMETINSN